MIGPAMGGLLFERYGFAYAVFPSFFFASALAVLAPMVIHVSGTIK